MPRSRAASSPPWSAPVCPPEMIRVRRLVFATTSNILRGVLIAGDRRFRFAVEQPANAVANATAALQLDANFGALVRGQLYFANLFLVFRVAHTQVVTTLIQGVARRTGRVR